MCGLVGILGQQGQQQQALARIETMKHSLRHRGPDGDGSYFDKQSAALAFGHQRLAIIDPENGQQPMFTHDHRYCIVFNGAIYNYLELRRELIARGHPIGSFSDTEVILYAHVEWGQACLERLHGMFAFAIWDTLEQRLFCARDRIGIKPFYFAYQNQQLIFASEIKAILASGLVERKVNGQGLQDYINFQFCLDDKTLFDGIDKLEPGYFLEAQLIGSEVKIDIKQYWDALPNIDEQHDESYFVDHLSSLLEESVLHHLRSDVPLGAHLSGGLDSSAVVSLAAPMLEGVSFKTFTGAFKEGPQFDETAYAKLVAKQVNADYQEIYIPSHEFSDVLPKIIHYMDEPVAGPGVIPQYYVSKLAAESVKVVLGGQGGDELYLGYARYLIAYLEKCLQGAIFDTADKQKYAISLDTIVPNLGLLQKYVPMLQHFWRDGLFESDDKRYYRLINRNEDLDHLFSPDVFGDYSPFASFQNSFNRDEFHSLVNRMAYFDLKASLPALLHVEDRTSMASSLESRVPLLDHRLVEFMMTIPPNIKFSAGRNKHLFKLAVKNILPRQIVERKDKMGFPVPINQWIMQESNDFVCDILFSQRAEQRGIYNTDAIKHYFKGEKVYSRVIWGLLCLELWMREFIDG